MVLSATSFILQLVLFTLDLVLVLLELTFLLPHLVSEFFQHGDLLTSLFVHDLGLLTDL